MHEIALTKKRAMNVKKIWEEYMGWFKEGKEKGEML